MQQFRLNKFFVAAMTFAALAKPLLSGSATLLETLHEAECTKVC